MNNKNFTTTVVVDQTPEEVFNAVNNVRGWWSENIEGNTDKLKEVFNYHYKDVHICKLKVDVLIPGKKVVWLVVDNYFSFIENKQEWVGTKIVFDIAQIENQTQLVFTHEGLVPDYECYNICFDAWTGYITTSLRNLIVTGKGSPTPKDTESEFNEELLRKNAVQQ